MSLVVNTKMNGKLSGSSPLLGTGHIYMCMCVNFSYPVLEQNICSTLLDE